MKQKELQLKDIAGYFPYDLKAYSDETNYKIWKVVKMHSNGGIILISNNKNSIGYQNIDIKELTPILYPLSSLYKKRMHNGEEIVPIVELAKIHNPDADWVKKGNIEAFNSESPEEWFDVSLENGDILCGFGNMFDFLNELKIDYRGLINAGLAVDVNTLDVNPYE
jgi:hypothetical protein